jgi:hypothetical protein
MTKDDGNSQPDDDIARRRAEAERRLVIRCARCTAEVAASAAESVGWRYWPDGLGGMRPFCPDCAAREFDCT